MKNPFKKNKDEQLLSSVKSTVKKTDGTILTTQIIPAKVIEVGDDEAEDGFSYKYSFINPINGEMEEQIDYLQTISVGEQIFDVGDDVNLLFTSNEDASEFTVTRQMVFPEIINKKERFRKLFKVLYIIISIFLFLVCCYSSQTTATLENTQQESTEEINNE